MRKILPAVVLSAFALTGCFERPVVDEGGGSKTKTEKPATDAKTPSGPKPVARTTMEGNWIAQISYQISPRGEIGWIPLLLLKISRADSGKFIPQLLDVPPRAKQWRITNSDISERTAHLVLTHEDQQFDIRVALHKTDALGNLVMSPSGLTGTVPARLLATTQSRLEAHQPVPHENHTEFNRAMHRFESQQETDELDALIKRHPRNPLSCFAVYRFDPILPVRTADSPRPDPKELRAHLKRLSGLEAVWGRRAALMARLAMARNLAHWTNRETGLVRRDINLEIAAEIVREVERPEFLKLLNDSQKALLKDLKTFVTLEQHIATILTTQDPQRLRAGVAHANRYLETAPKYQPWLLYALAEGNRKEGHVDKAIEQYARLLVMPAAALDLKAELEARWRKLPDLQKRLDELWKKKTGGTAGLDAYMAETYRKLMVDLLPDVVATRPAPFRKRVHLCELFTSCDDPACVGPDVATQLVQRTHQPVDVVVLRYHLDVPGPNPLVCNDSKLRAFDCQIPSAPMILVNGKPLAPRMGSTLVGVPPLAAIVRRAVHSDSATSPPAYRVRVSASARSGVLSLRAEADGPKKADPDLRLRLVLAEDRISYTGKNGIRHHDMVVRSMPGGIDGVALKPGKTTHAATVNLSELSGRLRDFLTSLEEKNNVKLDVKPVGFRKLHVVAFVQSTKGRREILQAASAVVDGLDAHIPPATKKAAKKAAAKP